MDLWIVHYTLRAGPGALSDGFFAIMLVFQTEVPMAQCRLDCLKSSLRSSTFPIGPGPDGYRSPPPNLVP